MRTESALLLQCGIFLLVHMGFTIAQVLPGDLQIPTCPDGSTPVQCIIDPCAIASCEAYPEAECRSNYCGGCNAEFYIAGRKVECDGVIKVGECPISEGDSETNPELICQFLCAHDGDCEGFQKCCYSGCSRFCVDSIQVPIGCVVDGKYWPVGSIRLWDCAVCKCLAGGFFVCLVDPGLICNPDIGPCTGDQPPYTLSNQAVFCDGSPNLNGAIHVDDCPKGYFCNALWEGYSVCCPEGNHCFYNGKHIPDGTEFLDGCALCACIDGGVKCMAPNGLLCDDTPCIYGLPYEGADDVTQFCSTSDDPENWPVLVSPCPTRYYCRELSYGYGVCCPRFFLAGCWIGFVFYPTGSIVIWNCRICKCYGGNWVCFYPPGLICDPLLDLPYGYLGDDIGEIYFCGNTLDPSVGDLSITIVKQCPDGSFCNSLDGDYAVCVKIRPIIEDGGCILPGIGYLPNGGVILMEDCVLCKCDNGNMVCIKQYCDGTPCGSGGLPYFESGYGTLFCGDGKDDRICPPGYDCTQLQGATGYRQAVCCPGTTNSGCPCPAIPRDASVVCLLDCEVCEATASYICCIDEVACPGHCFGFSNTVGYCEHECKFYLPPDVRYGDCEICTCTKKLNVIIDDIAVVDVEKFTTRSLRPALQSSVINQFLYRSGWICEEDPDCNLCDCPVDFSGFCFDDCAECEATPYYLCCRNDVCSTGCYGGTNIGWCEHDCEYYAVGTSYASACEKCTCGDDLEWHCVDTPNNPDCDPPCPCPTKLFSTFTDWQCWINCDDCAAIAGNLCCQDSLCAPGCLGGNNHGVCVYNCTYYGEGESYTENCEICTCYDGVFRCLPDPACTDTCIKGIPLVEAGALVTCVDVDCPQGYFCQNPPGLCCPRTDCETDDWTIWFDRDDPTVTGDWETIGSLIDAYGDEVCSNVVAIEVLTLDGELPESTGDIFLIYGPTGFVCRSQDQPGGRQCQDYKVRFCCEDEPADPCCLPFERGDCTSADLEEEKWYYDCMEGICRQFTYSGCGGNENRFDSKKECIKHCAADSCCLDADPGPCLAYFPMWYFDPRDNTCKEFIYGGCHGNDNRYETKQECESACRAFNQNITCEADRMIATISVEWLHQLLPNHENDQPGDYHLNEYDCVGKGRYIGQKDYYEFITDLEGCGTTSYEKPGDNRITYTNIIRTGRGTEIFELECCYETEYTIAPIHIITNPCCVLVTLQGFGTFNITATLYTDGTFITLFNENDFPLMICDGVFICFGIRVELHDPSLELFAEECYASESEDPQGMGPHYEMITNGCPNNDNTLIPYGTNDDLTLHFCWDAYDVVNRDDVEDGEEINLYIHCKVHVCKKNEAGTRCAQGCQKRKRREISDLSDDGDSTSTFITHGPLQKSNNCQG
ncbi:uncharacterized protein LOC144435157 [Glandiceps talaboti]